MTIRLIGTTVAAFLASLLLAASASAVTLTAEVTANTDTGGPGCELRQAIVAVTADVPVGDCSAVVSAADTVTFAPALSGQIIDLNASEILTANGEPMSIVGPGMGDLRVDAAANSRVFRIGGGTVTISGMTIRDGNPPTVDNGSEVSVRGGCVRNQGDLTLTDVRLTNCTATATAGPNRHVFVDGAAVGDDGAALTINDSLVDGNTTSATNAGNDAFLAQARGAIFSESGALTINNTTIEGNTATGTDNGTSEALAIAGLDFSNTTANISRSTISGNDATATEVIGNAFSVGGIRAQSSAGTIELSTIAGNHADSSASALTPHAGGLLTSGATTSIRSSTIALNGPDSATGIDGVNLATNGGMTNLANTILSDPRGGGLNCLEFGGSINSSGFNVDFSPAGASCFAIAGTDLDSNPLLDPAGPADNGGPTETIALQNTSPAIDAGLNAGITLSPAAQDQRGSSRPVDFPGLANAAGGNGTDIGSFEVQSTCAGQPTPGGTCPTPSGGNQSSGQTTPGEDPKCQRLRRKLKRQRENLDQAVTPEKRSQLERNIEKTRERLKQLDCN